ncbi:MAG TPA: hypothetical protein VMW24_25055 [Sedimentisphaerales bacterium]|nr:hypothetical protein [Sedimentisphaerales bacterium]
MVGDELWAKAVIAALRRAMRTEVTYHQAYCHSDTAWMQRQKEELETAWVRVENALVERNNTYFLTTKQALDYIQKVAHEMFMSVQVCPVAEDHAVLHVMGPRGFDDASKTLTPEFIDKIRWHPHRYVIIKEMLQDWETGFVGPNR